MLVCAARFLLFRILEKKPTRNRDQCKPERQKKQTQGKTGENGSTCICSLFWKYQKIRNASNGSVKTSVSSKRFVTFVKHIRLLGSCTCKFCYAMTYIPNLPQWLFIWELFVWKLISSIKMQSFVRSSTEIRIFFFVLLESCEVWIYVDLHCAGMSVPAEDDEAEQQDADRHRHSYQNDDADCPAWNETRALISVKTVILLWPFERHASFSDLRREPVCFQTLLQRTCLQNNWYDCTRALISAKAEQNADASKRWHFVRTFAWNKSENLGLKIPSVSVTRNCKIQKESAGKADSNDMLADFCFFFGSPLWTEFFLCKQKYILEAQILTEWNRHLPPGQSLLLFRLGWKERGLKLK